MADILTKKEFDEWIKFMKSSVLDLQVCTKNIQIIIDERDKVSDWFAVYEKFLGHYVYLSYSHSCLVICKLFLYREKQSFIKLFNKLAKFKYSSDLTEALHSTKEEILPKITDWKSLIEKNDPIIQRIKDRRDTFYAHYDPGKILDPEKLSEIIELSELANTIFQGMYNTLCGQSPLFNPQGFEIRPYPISGI